MIAIDDARFWVHFQEGNEWDEYASAYYLEELTETVEEARELLQQQAKHLLPWDTAYVFRVFAVSLIEEKRDRTERE